MLKYNTETILLNILIIARYCIEKIFVIKLQKTFRYGIIALNVKYKAAVHATINTSNKKLLDWILDSLHVNKQKRDTNISDFN